MLKSFLTLPPPEAFSDNSGSTASHLLQEWFPGPAEEEEKSCMSSQKECGSGLVGSHRREPFHIQKAIPLS